MRVTLKVAKSEKNSVVAWYWWQFHAPCQKTPGLGYHWPPMMKSRL